MADKTKLVVEQGVLRRASEALAAAHRALAARDEMNAALNMAAPRPGPLTGRVDAAADELVNVIARAPELTQ